VEIYTGLMSITAQNQMERSLRNLQSNLVQIAALHKKDQKCQELCETLIETTATVATWLRLGGHIGIKVTLTPIYWATADVGEQVDEIQEDEYLEPNEDDDDDDDDDDGRDREFDGRRLGDGSTGL
jgi:hypothetical protein